MTALADDPVSHDPTRSPEALAERSTLMNAALKVMRRNGFQGASVQDILDHAGLSTRAFYRQFQSKDDLLLAMFRTASEPEIARVATRVDKADTAIDAVHVWLDELLDIAYDCRRIQRLVMFNVVARQTVGYDEEVAFLRDGLVMPLVEGLVRGAADGSFPLSDPLPDAHAMFDLVWSTAGPTVRRLRPMDRAEARAHVLRFCLPALGVGRAG
ncbi:MAG: TetR/AcrR family transcriptional regulator [Acidimicrobiales bacterium]